MSKTNRHPQGNKFCHRAISETTVEKKNSIIRFRKFQDFSSIQYNLLY
jgi:hypothetical protein